MDTPGHPTEHTPGHPSGCGPGAGADPGTDPAGLARLVMAAAGVVEIARGLWCHPTMPLVTVRFNPGGDDPVGDALVALGRLREDLAISGAPVAVTERILRVRELAPVPITRILTPGGDPDGRVSRAALDALARLD